MRFRAYLLKGGFAVFEDFDGPQQWNNFEAQMRRVLPDGRFVKLENAHRIFDSFFRMRTSTSCTRCSASAELLRHLRGQRPGEAADGGRELRQRRAGILGVVGRGAVPVRHVERGLQARRQLHGLRVDALNRRARPSEAEKHDERDASFR